MDNPRNERPKEVRPVAFVTGASSGIGAECVRIFAERGWNIVAVARAQGVEVVLVTFAWSLGFHDYSKPMGQAYLQAYNEMNATIKRVAESTNTPLFDLAADFPDESELFVDAMHMTPAGADLKARRIAEFLVEVGLVTTSTQ